MPETLTHAHRFAKLTTPLGADKLMFLRLDASEGLSRPFEFRIRAMMSDKGAEADPNSVLGENCSVEVTDITGTSAPTRHFNGMCTELCWVGSTDGKNVYDLTLRPRLWGLSRQKDSRIFEKMTALAIIKQVLDDSNMGITHQEKSATDTGQIPYCVQYQETNLDFISRIMEKYGFFYYFTHTANEHKLIIVDKNESCETGPSVRYEEGASGVLGLIEKIESSGGLYSDKSTVQDYDHNSASRNLESNYTQTARHSRSNNEIYTYPAGYNAQGDGAKLAQVILEAERSNARQATATGAVPALMSGQKISIDRSPLPANLKDFLVVDATHTVASDMYRSIAKLPDMRPLSCTLRMVPTDQPFRAPLVTPVPRVAGTVVAKVAGSGEIDVDEKGRILLKFPWERSDAATQYRVRVAQPWAGSGWGSVFIPRVDQEVVVQYEHGDPDRPVVIGAVYNSDNAMPYSMPSEKTKSTIKSQTSTGGGGSNELRMEDKSGSEEVYIHAQKDMLREVENDDKLEVRNNQTITVKMNRTEEITQGNDSVTIKTGNRTVKLNAGQSTLDAMSSIELKCGSSSIKLTPADITIKSPMITVDASGTLMLKSSGMATLQAGGVCTITGSAIMIG